MVGLSLYPLKPRLERNVFLAIGLLSFTFTYGTLGATLEACSVWCWSAGSFGLWFLLRRRLA